MLHSMFLAEEVCAHFVRLSAVMCTGRSEHVRALAEGDTAALSRVLLFLLMPHDDRKRYVRRNANRQIDHKRDTGQKGSDGDGSIDPYVSTR